MLCVQNVASLTFLNPPPPLPLPLTYVFPLSHTAAGVDSLLIVIPLQCSPKADEDIWLSFMYFSLFYLLI